MTFGLRVVNDSQAVQIDSIYRILRFKESGTVAANVTYTFSHPVTTQLAPWIFLRPAAGNNPWFLNLTIHGSAGNWTGFTVRSCYAYNTVFYARNEGGWDFIVGAWDMTPNPGAYGMNLYDASGQLIFTDSARYIKLTFQFKTWVYSGTDQDNGVKYRFYTLDLPSGAELSNPANYLLMNPYAVENFNGTESYAEGQNMSTRVIGNMNTAQLKLVNQYGTKSSASFMAPGIIGSVSA